MGNSLCVDKRRNYTSLECIKLRDGSHDADTEI